MSDPTGINRDSTSSINSGAGAEKTQRKSILDPMIDKVNSVSKRLFSAMSVIKQVFVSSAQGEGVEKSRSFSLFGDSSNPINRKQSKKTNTYAMGAMDSFLSMFGVGKPLNKNNVEKQ